MRDFNECVLLTLWMTGQLNINTQSSSSIPGLETLPVYGPYISVKDLPIFVWMTMALNGSLKANH